IAAPLVPVELLTRALLDEFPDLDPERLRAAVERATAKAASAALDTAGTMVVSQHLARVEATEEASERAQILRDLADTLEVERADSDRALVVRLAAFAEVPLAGDIEPMLRLARVTNRLGELPLDKMTALVDVTAEASTRQLVGIADVWHTLGDAYRAADSYERVLLVSPADAHAHEALELFYRSTREWPVLVDLLGRRAVHVDDHERAELFREMAVLYERELGDDAGALDAFREADRIEPNRPDVLDSLARLILRVCAPDDPEALDILEKLARLVHEPRPRAAVLYRAADIARHHDYDRAQKLFERARADDPDLVPAIDGLAQLLRDRGMLDQVVPLLVDAAARPALAAERSRWLADAADFCVAQGDTERAKELYREARRADPTNHNAGIALVELCWDTGSLVELAPILDDLLRTTNDPARLHNYLVQRSKVAAQLGDSTSARHTLSRAVDLDPGDAAARHELADLMFDNQEWARARELIDKILDEQEDHLPIEEQVELHYRLARCAREIGDNDEASKQAGVTLALAPDHRPALLLRAELDAADPDALLADQLALANTAPADEKGARFAALGDRYVELGDRATAREMYREALAHKKTDHLLLTKFLELVADDGDWSYSLDLVQRLIDT
ncbi:MAG TPA: tetratricopeptide repeat protein, partial [Kofleriaceae bacterium]|nr:tetratricopeptide repeat protein [Kofleriaceae bacterium]